MPLYIVPAWLVHWRVPAPRRVQHRTEGGNTTYNWCVPEYLQAHLAFNISIHTVLTFRDRVVYETMVEGHITGVDIKYDLRSTLETTYFVIFTGSNNKSYLPCPPVVTQGVLRWFTMVCIIPIWCVKHKGSLQ